MALLQFSVFTHALIPDRRVDPSHLAPGYLVFPVYAHIPGIGSTYGAGFLVDNLGRTNWNLAGLASFGDTDTAYLQLNGISLIPRHLFLSFDGYSTSVPYMLFDRGMKGDAANFYYSLNKEAGGTGKIDFLLLNRRLTLSAYGTASRFKYAAVSTSSNDRFNNADNGASDLVSTTARATLDFTDDYWDPRKGLRLELSRNENAIFDHLHSRYYSLNAFVTAYVPVLSSSTWAFNAYRGTAFVYNKNNVSQAQLQSAMSLNCTSISDPTKQANCQKVETQRITQRQQENQDGTGALLGGPNQLRGYPYGRYTGSEAVFYATEFRWNVIEGNHPFDLGFFQGALSVIQLAPFYEIGAVSDPPTPVEKAAYRSTYGAGLRIGFSGAILRADLGFSSEGTQFTMFVGYPWGLAPF